MTGEYLMGIGLTSGKEDGMRGGVCPWRVATRAGQPNEGEEKETAGSLFESMSHYPFLACSLAPQTKLVPLQCLPLSQDCNKTFLL